MSEKSLHEINSRKHERKAALLTFLCSSGMVVLCFLITAFTIQDPPPGEQYVAVDFAEIGEVEDAGGVTETEVPSEVVEEVVEEQESVESIQEPVQAEEVVTQEESEVAIQEVVEEVEEEEPTVEEPEESPKERTLSVNSPLLAEEVLKVIQKALETKVQKMVVSREQAWLLVTLDLLL